MTMPWYEEAFMHYLGGVFASGADRVLSKNSRRFKDTRIKEKLGQVESLQYIVEHHEATETDNPEFHSHIMNARAYFEDRGVSVEREGQEQNLGVIDKVKQTFRNIGYYRNHERFNNRSLGGKIAAATGFELAGDCIALIGQLTIGKGDIAVALGEDIYQVPSFALGLITGRVFIYGFDLATYSKEEKEIDSIARELISDGKLLAIVKNYSPTVRVMMPSRGNVIDVESEKPALSDDRETSSETKISSNYGARVGEAIANSAGSIGNAIGSGINSIRQRMQARRDRAKTEDDRRRAELRDKYEKY